MDANALGGSEVALVAAIVLLGGFILETRVFPRFRVPLYHDVGLPLGIEVPPIPKTPSGRGDAPSVDWSADERRGRFWARPGDRRAPSGLHGTIRFEEGPQGTHLRFSWSPPWSLGMAAGWLATLGVLRGDGPLMVPLAVLLLSLAVGLYWSQARRIAEELRATFARHFPG